MEKISSVKNSKVKEWVKLKTNNGRKKFHKFLLEGQHPVQEALAAQVDFEYIIIEENHDFDFIDNIDDDKLIIVTKEVAKHISDTIHNQGIFMIGYMDEKTWQFPSDISGKWLVLDDVQDPGNIGTMVRTADAAGFKGVIFGDGTADFYNPKILRSMQGSQYHLELRRLNLFKWIKKAKEHGHSIYGSILNKDAKNYEKIVAPENLSLIMGNEGRGMQSELISLTDANLYIPIKGQAESLNVAVAAGILMFKLN